MDQINTHNSLPELAGFDNSREMIRVTGVSKVYRLGETPMARLRGALGLGSAGKFAEHHALDDVSFVINKGETVGIIGSNGAGKSTLLQIITGTLTPTSGSVKTVGRISALLELGSGFNPEWTGRRNAEFQCILQGVPSAEIAAKLGAIEDFADIGAYFDQPARTYSSGMFLRVAFASAIATEPEILIVDEALAVGDVRFQNKCFRRFEEMQKAGCTILFVTHSTELVTRFCSRCIVMHGGLPIFDGSPIDGVKAYLEALYGTSAVLPKAHRDIDATESSLKIEAIPAEDYSKVIVETIENRPYYNSDSERIGNFHARIVDVIINSDQNPNQIFESNRKTKFNFIVVVDTIQYFSHPHLGIIVKTKDGSTIYGTTTILLGNIIQPITKNIRMYFEVSFDVIFYAGDYFLDIGFGDLDSNGELVVSDWRFSVVHFSVTSASSFYGLVDLNATCVEWHRAPF